MYVHLERRLVYLAHPKTATHSVQEAIRPLGFMPAVRNQHLTPVRLSNGPSWHHRGLEEHPGDGWHVFTTIRNHFDAWASWWAYTQETNAFSDLQGVPLDAAFVEEMLRRSPEYWPEPDRMWALHCRHADTVLRFEDQERGLRELLGELFLTLKHLNGSSLRAGRHYREMISPALRAYIEDRFGAEMEEMGYEW